MTPSVVVIYYGVSLVKIQENFKSNLSVERIGLIKMLPGRTWIEYILQTRLFFGL